MKCFKCGFSQPDDSIFCEKCGTKLDTPKTVRCTVCGHEQIDGAFCDICGKPTKGVSTEQPISVRPFADRWEELQKAKKRSVEKAKANTSRKSLIVGICCVSVCILAAGGVLLYMVSNKNKENVKTDRIVSSESSDNSDSFTATEAPLNSTPETTTTVTTTQTEISTTKEETKPEAASEDWIDEYIEQAKAFEKDTHKIPNDATLTYILLYLNGDDIPELLMQSSLVTSELYTVANGHAKLLHYGDTPRQGCFITANESAHTYAYYDMPNGFNETYSVIKLNDDGSTEIESQFGTRDGEYYIDDKSATKQEVENCRISLIGMIQRPQYTSAAELETELNKFRKQGTPAKKKVEVIPATELIDMSTSDIRKLIGDDYTIYENHEYDYMGYEPTYGITNSTYFPNTYLYFYGDYTADEVKDIFEKDTPISFVQVLDGGLIGDKAKVGDTYHDMLTLVDSLSGLDSKGVNTNLGTGISIVDGHEVYMYFDHIEDLRKLATGHEVVDAYNTDAKCVKATISSEGYTHTEVKIAKVTGDEVAIRVAPYADATALLNAEKGADIYLENANVLNVNGDKWYQVHAYYYKGVQKIGYIHAKYVKITN